MVRARVKNKKAELPKLPVPMHLIYVLGPHLM
jgi:hypothetical protein